MGGGRVRLECPPPKQNGPDGSEPRSLSLTAAIFWTLGPTTCKTFSVDVPLWISTNHTDNSLHCKRMPKFRARAVRPEGCFCNWKAKFYFCLLNVDAKGHQGLTWKWNETGQSRNLFTLCKLVDRCTWGGRRLVHLWRLSFSKLSSDIFIHLSIYLFIFPEPIVEHMRTQRLLEVSSTNSGGKPMNKKETSRQIFTRFQ